MCLKSRYITNSYSQFPFPTRRGCALACILLYMCLFCSISLAANSIQQSICLSGAYAKSSKPSISAAANGDCAVAWVESNQTISVRQRKGGNWLPQDSLKKEPPADVDQPKVRLDSAGNPHVIWAAAAGGQNTVEYAFQTIANGVSSWTQYGALDTPTSGKISSQNLFIDAQNQIFAIWQENEGSSHRIHAFTLASAGKATHQILAGKDTPGPFIYPDLLQAHSPLDGKMRVLAAWYDIRGRAKLEMSLWNPDSAQWESFAAPENPDAIMQCLPLVAEFQSQVCLIGYRCGQDQSRIFLNDSQNRLAWLSDSGNNRYPKISIPSNAGIGLVWQKESDSGAELVQAVLRNDGTIWEVPVTKLDNFIPPEPDVAIADKSVMSVWVSQGDRPSNPIDFSPSSPSSAIFFAETAIPDQGWKKIEYTAAN
jgi:hypothetical protein